MDICYCSQAPAEMRLERGITFKALSNSAEELESTSVAGERAVLHCILFGRNKTILTPPSPVPYLQKGILLSRLF